MADIIRDSEFKEICWARVKHLSGPLLGRIETVAVNRLNKAFLTTEFNKFSKYKMDGNIKVQLLHLASTHDDMEKKIDRTRRAPPANKLVSATSGSDEQEWVPSTSKGSAKKTRLSKNSAKARSNKESTKKTTLSKNSGDGRLSKEKRDAEFAKIMNMKLENVKALGSKRKGDHSETKKQSSENIEGSENDDDNTNSQETKKRALSPSVESVDLTSSRHETKVPRIMDESHVKESVSLDKPAVLDKNEPEIHSEKEIGKHSSNRADIKVMSSAVVDAKSLLDLSTKYEGLKKDLEKLKDKLSKLKKEKEKLNKTIDTLKADNAALLSDNSEVHKLNVDLQKKVIDFFEVQKIVEKQVKESTVTPMADPYNVPIGHPFQSGEIHLGQGVRIDANSLSNVLSSATKPSILVGNLLVAKFTEQVLQTSSRTGNSSNRSDPAKKGDLKPLDKKILLGIKSYFGHWLKTSYPDFLSSEDKATFDVATELKKFNSYVTAKIANLKKPKEPSKKGSKKRNPGTSTPPNEVIDEEIPENGLPNDSPFNLSPLQSLRKMPSIDFVTTKDYGESDDSDSIVSESELVSDYDDQDPLAVEETSSNDAQQIKSDEKNNIEEETET